MLPGGRRIMTTPADVVAVARRYIGVTESPRGSNAQRFGRWYGFDRVPWCAIFASFCLWTAGIRVTGATTRKGWSACADIAAWGKRNGRLHAKPKVGDLALFDSERNGV